MACQQYLTQLVTPSLKYFPLLFSRTPDSLVFPPISLVLILSLLYRSLLFLMLECPWLCPSHSLCSLPGDIYQSHSFKYHFYVHSSQIYVSSLCLSPKFQILLSSCLLSISTWIFNRYFKLNVTKIKLSIFLPCFPTSTDTYSIL